MTALRLALVVRTYRRPGMKPAARWTWMLFHNTSPEQAIEAIGSQLFSRRVDCARSAEVGAGLTGVRELLAGKATTAGDVGRAVRMTEHGPEAVEVEVVDQRRAS